jgi:DNA-binding NtrC family response regulator
MSDFTRILGQSDAARAMCAFGQRAAAVDAPILLSGESGTGKGLLARAIHIASARARSPFIAVNCAGVPESLFESEFFGHNRGAFTGAHEARRGLFEQAHGGTLFLDEIGDLPLPLQAKLLTTLEDGEVRRLGSERTTRVDVRLIAATGAALQDEVQRGRFRRDLYHRLLVLSFHLPPLREREGDVEFLAHHFLDLHRRKYRRPPLALEPATLSRLRTYAWPGNVRELAHAMEAATLNCEDARIRVEHLPRTLLEPPSPPTDAEPHAPAGARYAFYGAPEEERRHILEALRKCRGNKTRAAALLGMARNTLRLKLRALGLEHHDRALSHAPHP